MSAHATDVAIVGSGVCGLLVARELTARGREVTVIERGGLRPHADQEGEPGGWELDLETTRHTEESHADVPPHPWDYVYGIGGTTLKWTGVALRLMPADFELRSRYGVGRDWPISYDDLAPFYDEAEGALAVAAGENELYGRPGPKAQPPHPFSPVDRVVAPVLQPYRPLPQARPTQAVDGRPACCATARCHLCPVDSRYSALHTLDTIGDRPNLKLIERTVVASVKHAGGRATELACRRDDGERATVRANTVVLAANGLENASILLRSGLEGRDTGRWLFDHVHRILYFRTDRPVPHGRGTSLATGMSFRYADGAFRARRGSVLVYPFNPGAPSSDAMIDALLRGERGPALRERMRRRFDHTLVLDTVSEDLPLRERYVELSPNRDGLGIPRQRIRYPGDSRYSKDGVDFVIRDLHERLRPLGARLEIVDSGVKGGHQLGTCRMGPDGVVDEHLRHHGVRNLYVAGGSAFPTYSPAHPTLTIAALAIRLGRHLARA